MGVKIIGAGGGILSSDVTAAKAQVLTGYSTVTSDSDDEVVEGIMKNLSDDSSITCDSVKVVQGDAGFYGTNSDNTQRYSVRYNGDQGYISSGSYISLGQPELQSSLNLTNIRSKYPTTLTIGGVSGTMPNVGTQIGQLGLSNSVAISKGYHNGSGKVTRATYSTMSGSTITPSQSDQTISTSGKIVTSAITCKGDQNLIASNIVRGKNIFGVAGQFETSQTMQRDQQVYNGSTFSGVLQGGMICGVRCPFLDNYRNYVAYFYGFGSGGYDSDGYTDNSTLTQNLRITSGPLNSGDYYMNYANTSEGLAYEGPYGGIVSYNSIDFSLFSKLRVIGNCTVTDSAWSEDYVMIVARETATSTVYDGKVEEELIGIKNGNILGPGKTLAYVHEADGTVRFDETFDISGWTGNHFLTLYCATNADHEAVTAHSRMRWNWSITGIYFYA